MDTFPTYNEGTNFYWHNGQKTPYPAAIGIPINQSIGETAVAIAKLSAICLTITPGKPWEHLLANYWDSITFKDWIDRTAVVRGRQAAALADLLLDAVGRARAGLGALHVQLHRLGR